MRKCRNCKKPFEPKYNTMQKVCSVECGIAEVRKKQVKAYKKETLRMKREFKGKDLTWQLGVTQTSASTLWAALKAATPALRFAASARDLDRLL